MQKGIIRTAIALIAAVPGFMMQTNPNDVMTNIGAWYQFVLQEDPPTWLNTPSADNFTLMMSIALLSLSFVLFFYPQLKACFYSASQTVSKFSGRNVPAEKKEKTGCLNDRVFVGNVSASGGLLDDYVLVLSIEGTNRTGADIAVVGVQGNILARRIINESGGIIEDYGKLPAASLRERYVLHDGSDFWIFVEQRVSKELAVAITCLTSDQSVHLLLEDFRLVMRYGLDEFRFKISDGVRLFMIDKRLLSSRCVVAKPV